MNYSKVSPSPELLAENIIKLVVNKGERTSMSEAAHDHIIKNFSWDKAAGELEEKFKEHLKG